MKKLVFTVTNDLTYDQRMIRICSSLQAAGYAVTLVGRKMPHSKPLTQQPFLQKRLYCFFTKGPLFYVEYNLRLFVHLLFCTCDAIIAIDLDTIIPCYITASLRNKKRVYDAHELFCEMKEVVSRPRVFKIWKSIEKKVVPHFKYGYTVNEHIKAILQKDYGVDYEVVRNLPLLRRVEAPSQSAPFIIYQGAVNEGRSFETLIPAFQWIPVPIHIYGDGNFLEEATALINKHHLQQKVNLKGKATPDVLRTITPAAIMGITLFENNGLSNYYSLANRFFDYIHAGIPQLCVGYPEYEKINNEWPVAVLITDLSPQSLAAAINGLIENQELQQQLRYNCLQAREVLNWQEEEKKLIPFYQNLFHAG